MGGGIIFSYNRSPCSRSDNMKERDLVRLWPNFLICKESVILFLITTFTYNDFESMSLSQILNQIACKM